MKIWRLFLALICGLLMAPAFLVSLDPEKLVKAGPPSVWFWKAGGWLDYALNGVPDFDQKQSWFIPSPPGLWTYCGPVAAADSLWWFDSKFEPDPKPPVVQNDNYFLINPYLFSQAAGLDDHDPVNVGGMVNPGVGAPPGAIPPPGLVDDLAWYFDTGAQRSHAAPAWTGTRVQDMFYGLQWWLYGGNPLWGPGPAGPRLGSYYDDYYVMMVKAPTWDWVVSEVERSEDVILLVGFYYEAPPGSGYYARVGGHFVTVAGVAPGSNQIAISDPYYDNQEAGGLGGQVFSGTLPLYRHTPIPGHPGYIHNDAGNVSYDAYSVAPIPYPYNYALWEITGYGYNPFVDSNFVGQNTPTELQNFGNPVFPPIRTFVEYAVAVSPFNWKPGGEWVYEYHDDRWGWEYRSFEDDGDSCLPDFTWSGTGLYPQLAYDGPTALADSLWWFDSKAETLVTGGSTAKPPTISDHFPLVNSYNIQWDDHAISNTLPLINDLATNYLDTGLHGTTAAEMAAGIQDYLEETDTDQDFFTVTQSAPSFNWVADEVNACEDVVMLLGFYEKLGDGTWQRKGGHWVDAAGVNKENGQIGLSDPWFDNSNVQSFFDIVHTGRVFPPEHLGTTFTEAEKKQPQSISHDIYFSTASPVTPYQWALDKYPAQDKIGSAIGLNGGGTVWAGTTISTVVEWAIGISPYADLIITKTALVTEVKTTRPITYVIEYANTGLASVSNVLISDNPPLSVLSNLAYRTMPPLTANPGIGLSWTIPKLGFGQGGVITITAMVNEPLVGGVYTNTATISVPAAERSPANNTSQATILIYQPLYLPVVRK